MIKVWDIKLYQTKKGYKVKIEGFDPYLGISEKADAESDTPQHAYSWCMEKLVIKPWLVNAE